MDDDYGFGDHVLKLSEREFTILIPALALISCANSRAMELGGGFHWGESGWQLHWPDEVAQGFGLRPSDVQMAEGDQEAFKLLFEPVSSNGPSYWSTLFAGAAPALVISYEVSSDEPPIISPMDYEWLHWPWHVTEDEQFLALEKAIAAQEDLADQVDWVTLAMQAGTDGPRSILFKGVCDHLQRG